MDDQTSRIIYAEHNSPGLGSWRMAFMTPTERLAPYVARFNAYCESDTGFVRRRETPSGLAGASHFELLQAVDSSSICV
jgi:hypothetical protein